MNKADKYLKDTITEILEDGQWDKNPRALWSDGTPAHSLSIRQKVYQYDISKGEFPITTLRNGSLKAAFQELKTIYINQSNKQEDFVKNGVTWWSEWMNEEGNLGTAYSWNLEGGLSEDIITPENLDFNEIKTSTKSQNLLNSIEDSIDGKIYQDFKNKGFIIIQIIKDSIYSHTMCKIQFLNTGSFKIIREGQLFSRIDKGIVITDRYERDLYGVGFFKNINLSKEYPKEYEKWKGLIRRCYGKNQKSSYIYSEVDERWHCFDNFIEDLPYIPNYFIAKREDFKKWDLDKDYYSDYIKIYSPKTCVFLKESYNALYRDKNYYRVILKDGSIEYAIGIKMLSKTLSVDFRSLETKMYYERKKERLGNHFIIGGNKVERIETTLRCKNSKNQVNELLKNLEFDKFSRRHTISFFNWEAQDNKSLVECAFQSLFSVREVNGLNYLDSTLIQRSSDFLTAGNINCSQYVMLNMIICNHLKHKTNEEWLTGKFMWVVQNVHIYDRHLDSAKEVLERESTELQPKIELICEPKDFYQHTIEDFKFSGLEGIEKLSNKLEIAI